MIFDGAKALIYAGAAIVVGVLAYKAYDAIGDAREAKVVAKYRAEYDRLAAESRAKEQAQRDQIHAASTRYEEQIAALRADATPVPIVSLPKCPRRTPEPSAATTGSQPSEAPADGLDRENGPTRAEVEFSLGLREYAKDCKAIAIQLTEVIQAWPK